MRVPSVEHYPKKLYVRGDVYTVKFVDNLKDLGVTDAGARTIKIRAGMSKNETFKTFLHELLHAIEFSTPVKLKHKTVYKLEDALFNLFIDNFL